MERNQVSGGCVPCLVALKTELLPYLANLAQELGSVFMFAERSRISQAFFDNF